MYSFFKRIVDFLASLIGLLLLSPILLITAIVLKLTGEGKVLFTQSRVGHKNKFFKIYKFTTMLSTPPSMKGKTITGKRDPRITPIGAFLRNSKIDEFPQLFNVLKGDMSPGITAIGSVVFRDEGALITQVKELGKDPGEFKQKVIFPYKGQLEVWYNKHQSFWVDLKILLLTAWTLIFPTSQLAFKAFTDLPERGDLLKLELNRMQELKESVTLLGIMVAVLIPLVPSPFLFWDNLQFILMALIPFLGFAYLLYRNKEIPVQLIPSDVGWIVFLGLGFLSFFWAINGSLIWYQGFGWLSLILWMLLFRAISVRDTAINIMPILFLLFFLVMMVHHLMALFFNVGIDENWNHFFGKNANYTSCFLVGLYPYLLFFHSKYRIIGWLKLFFTAAILLTLYVANAPWAILALFFVGLYYLWTNESRQDFLGVMGVLTTFIFFLVTLSFFNPTVVASLPGVSLFSELSTSFRYYLISNSNLILWENPLIGIGLGNWHLEAYKFDVSNIAAFNVPDNFIRHRSHHLYTRLFAELGLIGGLAFLYPMITALGRGWGERIRKNSFHKAAAASFMVYLIVSFFYSDVNFYEFHFSGIQLLAFCALGILTNNSMRQFVLPKWGKIGLLILTIFSLAWFVYSKFANDNYWKIKKESNSQNIGTSIEELETLYHPIFKTTHGFDQAYNRLIALDLAQLYLAQNDQDKAAYYFKRARSQAPNDEHVLLAYASFLLQEQKDVPLAKELALQMYGVQHNNYAVNLLLAQIAVLEQDKVRARKYLATIPMENEEFAQRREKLDLEIEALEK